MDVGARARRAARETVDDVEPAALREDIDQLLASRSMSPGALVFRFALLADDQADPATASDRAAGVQLIYDGLRLTRELAHDEPWSDPAQRDDADRSILAADVLVSRGFYLLADTEAAGKAVETVRSFGRTQTHRREDGADEQSCDAQLERDALELAAIAGATLTDTDASDQFVDAAGRIANSVGVPLPPAEHVLAELDAITPSPSPPSDDPLSTSDG